MVFLGFFELLQVLYQFFKFKYSCILYVIKCINLTKICIFGGFYGLQMAILEVLCLKYLCLCIAFYLYILCEIFNQGEV